MTTLVVIGGFLGAGKTSLLLAAAAHLKAAGERVGVILNDQGEDLVDTQAARAAGLEAEEVAGGCFCCRFSDFVARAASLTARRTPEVILAEPVGSCTDLAATVLRPLRKLYGGRFRIAPLTVLIDPAREAENLAPDLRYLFERQVAEADVVLYTKSDIHAAPPGARRVSALTGEGVADWLEEVLASDSGGARQIDVDYARYAAAEAALGWLNWSVELRSARALTPAAVAGPLLESLDRALSGANAAIAHLKVFVESAGGYLKASVCRNGEEPVVEGPLDALPALRHRLVLNLRAAAAPAVLEAVAEQALKKLGGRAHIVRRECFQPPAPVPQYRFMEAAV